MSTAASELDLRVHKIQYEAEGVQSFDLRALDGRDLPPFTPGAHVNLHLPNRIVRSYSLANSSAERHRYVVGIAKDAKSRGGSKYMHETLRVGDTLKVSAPANDFPLVEDAAEVVLIAGGIGITPLYCMAQRLESLGRKWKLFYSARTRAHCAYMRELQALEELAPGRVDLNFDLEPGGKMYDLAAVVAAQSADAHFYCCGPAPMIEAFEQACSSRPADHVHVEYFAAKEAPAEGGFSVELARSGVTIAVPEDQSILDTLIDAGVDLPYSCMNGVCGECETTVLEGIPDHRDIYLSEDERDRNDKIMICVSGCKTAKLVLDL